MVCFDRYPDSWYQDITSNKKFFSLAATFRGKIVGMIVAEIKGRTKVHKEVQSLFSSTRKNVMLNYMLEHKSMMNVQYLF